MLAEDTPLRRGGCTTGGSPEKEIPGETMIPAIPEKGMKEGVPGFFLLELG
ncbi:unnamed protein product, partial [marine sediment metagenome]